MRRRHIHRPWNPGHKTMRRGIVVTALRLFAAQSALSLPRAGTGAIHPAGRSPRPWSPGSIPASRAVPAPGSRPRCRLGSNPSGPACRPPSRGRFAPVFTAGSLPACRHRRVATAADGERARFRIPRPGIALKSPACFLSLRLALILHKPAAFFCRTSGTSDFPGLSEHLRIFDRALRTEWYRRPAWCSAP